MPSLSLVTKLAHQPELAGMQGLAHGYFLYGQLEDTHTKGVVSSGCKINDGGSFGYIDAGLWHDHSRHNSFHLCHSFLTALVDSDAAAAAVVRWVDAFIVIGEAS